MFHVDQSVEDRAVSERNCSRCTVRPRRKGGDLCLGCHALDMRNRRRQARRKVLAEGTQKRRGRKDGQL